MMPIALTHWQPLCSDARAALLRRPAAEIDIGLREKVGQILAAVSARGDAAIREFTRRFDGVDIDDCTVKEAEFAAAEEALDVAAIRAIDLAIANVRRFHEAQYPRVVEVETMAGVCCRRVSHALDAVGLYVPAGTAPLPSAAIMLAVPATIAACPTCILCTPPRADGSADPGVLVAARRAGVCRIFKVGGAQAIAAMAYGTATIPQVLKIFGPGNAWVTAAKTMVASDPNGAAIDMPAGPSEVLVLADDSAAPEFVAADLLSQAEHGPDSQVLLVTPSAALARAVQRQLESQIARLPRAGIARQALDKSHIIVVESIGDAISVSNRYAPEHLILHVEDGESLLPQVRNAGSVFVGPWAPESAGDYCSGTNHVLPTYGHARTYSGLGVDQFMRQMTIQALTREGLAALGEAIVELARLEGLDAHAAAVTRRLGSEP